MPIVFLVHRGKDYTVRKFLKGWGRDLGSLVSAKNYPGLRSIGRTPWKRFEQTIAAWRTGSFRVPRGEAAVPRAVVFTDLDRLSDPERIAALDLRRELKERVQNVRLLNHPGRSMQRFELLQTLAEKGINSFGVYRADRHVKPRSWPVLLRDEDDHGFASELLGSPQELNAELERADTNGELGSKIVVEFCPTADDEGIIRKYGAFRVGSRIVARQVHFSRNWMLRFPDIRTEETSREELEYVEQNPHCRELMEIFEHARIEYGRIDYSLQRDRIQVWEINTNPMILIPADREDPLRRPAHEEFAARFCEALSELMLDSASHAG